ncbi:hypothetical protein C8R44DRAFT_650196 [Mycena epipterygia]|nr:hypothetical protein C8R44DRAFT_650196 [Mycena epipterygia]
MSSAATAPAATAAARADTTGSNRASSRLAHLLASNDIPLDSEIPAIHQFISDNQSRVDALDARIDVLRIAMKKLIAERDPIQESVRKHAAIVSTICRVPPDVMCQIFALTLPHTMRIRLLPVKRPPWRLGHICRSWRNWALADPFLWRSIITVFLNSIRQSRVTGGVVEYELWFFVTRHRGSCRIGSTVHKITKHCS